MIRPVVVQKMSSPETSLPPGFRFHPTDEELILHYLRNKASSLPCPVAIIAEVDIYKFDPWDLPGKAAFGEKEWYFFSPRDRKYPNGARPNRAAASGYWKATGTDKPVVASGGANENIGVKKALVFYKGRPPKGIKTNWIMHEYRLTQPPTARPIISSYKDSSSSSSMRLDDWVLCRIYRKSSPLPPTPSDDEDVASFTSQSGPPVIQNSSSFSDLLAAADYSLLTRLLSDHPSDSTGSEVQLMSSAFPSYVHADPSPAVITSSAAYSAAALQQVEKLSHSQQGESSSPQVLQLQNQFKRERSSGNDDNFLPQSSKKLNHFCTLTSFSNSSPDQPVFNQHLLSSHLQFQ